MEVTVDNAREKCDDIRNKWEFRCELEIYYFIVLRRIFSFSFSKSAFFKEMDITNERENAQRKCAISPPEKPIHLLREIY